MKFVQYRQDVIWKEGRMCLKGRPFEVEDNFGISVFSADPQFEKLERKEVHEEKIEAPAATEVLVPRTPEIPKGKECAKCHKLIPRGWYMHQRWCRG